MAKSPLTEAAFPMEPDIAEGFFEISISGAEDGKVVGAGWIVTSEDNYFVPTDGEDAPTGGVSPF